MYDIVNFNDTQHTLTTTSDWPDDFEMTGVFGAALRVNNYKIIVGCGTRTGCSRNYNNTWKGNIETTRTTLFNLNTDPEEKINLADSAEHNKMLSDLISRLSRHVEKAVKPNHVPNSSSGLPIYSFPPGQFFTGWGD